MNRKIILWLIVGSVCLNLAARSSAYNNVGDVINVFDYPASDLVLHPTKPLIYAAGYYDNSVAIINTNSLSVVDVIQLPAAPWDLTVSSDGAKLFLACGRTVQVVDTNTLNVSSFPLNITAIGIAYGGGDRLFLAEYDNYRLVQLNATTGLPSGDAYSPSGHFLTTSADGSTLYVADSGLSPATLYEWDVTPPRMELIWQSEHGSLGSNGSDFALSHDETFMAFAVGSGNQLAGGYDIGILDTATKEVLGVLQVGPYPRAITFSPDDKLAYVINEMNNVKLFSTETFSLVDEWQFGPRGEEAQEILTDHAGGKLFAATYNPFDLRQQLVVFTTREIIPEPSTSVLVLMWSLMGFSRWEERWRTC